MTDEQIVDLSRVDASDPDEWKDLSLPDRLAWLKSTVSMYDIVDLLGLEMTSGNKIISPWNPEERTPSCHVFDDHVWCFSTGQGGDIFDVVKLASGEEKLGNVVKAIKNRVVRAGLEYGQVETQKPRELTDFGPQLESLERVPEMFGFDVTGFDIRRSAEGDILVPHADDSGVYGVKVRYARGGKGSWAGSQFTHRLYTKSSLWSAGFQPTQQAVICEGESDCWALSSVLPGVDVYALPSGAGAWKDHWLDDLGCYYKIWVCVDNDRAGAQCRDKIIPKLGWGRTSRLDVPQLYGDAREAIAAGWVPSL